MIYLPGGPPHQDIWDMKPDAPLEIRGDFSPIRTNVRGIEICELFPRMARMMDKFIAIRSIVGSIGHHSAFQCMTGRHPGNHRQVTGLTLDPSCPSFKGRYDRGLRRQLVCHPSRSTCPIV